MSRWYRAPEIILQQAEYDSDPEVEETAKWALKKLNRTNIR